jgi:hypothetical protein
VGTPYVADHFKPNTNAANKAMINRAIARICWRRLVNMGIRFKWLGRLPRK